MCEDDDDDDVKDCCCCCCWRQASAPLGFMPTGDTTIMLPFFGV